MSSGADNIVIVREEESNSVFRIIRRFFKNFVTISTVYLVGYFDWSIAWLIAPVILSAFREEWKKSKERKRESVKLAIQNEKKVILSVIGEDLPSWVFFPDIERAEWVNKMLLQMWPSITVYAHDMIKTTVQPKIQETLEMYNMKGFEFVKLRLGTIPPRIGGIKVYDRQYSPRTEIMMDVDLIYAGDCDISFTFKGFSGGIKDFQIHGMMRLIMKPLLPVIPFVGGIQVFFLNKPTIDFNLVGIADVLDIPGISDVLRKVIVEQIAAMMVLPNKLPIVLSDAVPAQTIKIPEPEGVLRVHVVQAIKLLKKDVSMLGRGKSDPYVIISMGAQEFRSKTIDNTVNPKWDYWCEFTLDADCDTRLNLVVYDQDDTSKKDDFLGRASLKLDDVFEKGEVDKWITLEEVKHGMVHLRMTYYHLSSEVSDLKAALDEIAMLRVPSINSTVLIFYLDSLQNLPDAKAGKRPDPVVTITAGHETKSTGVQFRTNCPVYEQGFLFLIHNPETESFTLKVTDQKTGSELAFLNYPLNTLLNKEGWKRDLEPLVLNKVGENCKLVFAAQLKALKKSIVSKDSTTTVDPPATNVTPPATPSPTPTEVIQPDVVTDAARSNDETSKDVQSISNEDSVSNDLKSLSSTSANEEDVNWDAFKSEEVKNSCQWITNQYETPRQNSISGSMKGSLRRRKPSQTESLKNLGSMELSLHYKAPRQKLIITVHRIIDLPAKDPTDLPDPYVKIYLMPHKSKDNKRKTKVIKDTCNPVYEESFNYVISEDEIPHRQLSISVVSQKTTFYSTNSVMGQVTIDLQNAKLDGTKVLHALEPQAD